MLIAQHQTFVEGDEYSGFGIHAKPFVIPTFATQFMNKESDIKYEETIGVNAKRHKEATDNLNKSNRGQV